ncbi:hypothetical protein H6G98_02805 [Nostoc sp. FACHB-857]|nr:hypothetical protein [Nostoc sp. FACHB-857]
MRETRRQGDKLQQVFPRVPVSPCLRVLFPMPNAPCPMPIYIGASIFEYHISDMPI